ncbi:putative PDDEXK endonuclease [Dinoroseobacter sp. S375]|uniref:putative PDDEXK endonuclease n=1 Tax=Dinoroseobacter sp. S375 TaxID=3415136 RepID=UPI003C79A2E8
MTGANSRRKGAAFERDVAKLLFLETGIEFKRDLDQTREEARGDLITECQDWPFLIECKNWAAAKTFRSEWAVQAHEAAEKAGKFPCVVYKANRGEVRVRVWFDAIAATFGGHAITHQHAEVSLQGLAYLAREMMAEGVSK